MKRVYTTGQVAKLAKVAPRTVSKWFDSGDLKGYRIPGSLDWRIPYESLLDFFRRHKMPQAEELEQSVKSRVLSVGLNGRGKLLETSITGEDVVLTQVDNTFEAGREVACVPYPVVVVFDSALGYSNVMDGIRHIKGKVELSRTAIVVIEGEEGSGGRLYDGSDVVFKEPFDPDGLITDLKHRIEVIGSAC
jgi:excisionase family DNA binding protein